MVCGESGFLPEKDHLIFSPIYGVNIDTCVYTLRILISMLYYVNQIVFGFQITCLDFKIFLKLCCVMSNLF